VKSILAIISGLILVSSVQAMACPRSANQLICPDDTIVSDDNIVGFVVGVNPFQGTVAFRSKSTGNIITRDKLSLALGIGCLEMYCVGDTIVSNDNIVGTILAVNPFQNTIAFQSYSSGNVITRPLESLSFDIGCIRGVCVGDTIISSDNITGLVLAVNPFYGTVAFRSYSSGNVITRQVETLSSTNYCDDYGHYSRTHIRYPFINEEAYTHIKLKFSIQRPQRP
jgi:hypothetical protein